MQLSDPGVSVTGAPWVSRGLQDVTTVALEFDGVSALDVGPEDWYLSRPGFAAGGIGVAAVWWGAATALAQYLHIALADRAASSAANSGAGAGQAGQSDQISLLQLGRCDTSLFAAGAVLEHFAERIDRQGFRGPEWAEALRARSIVHDSCETVLTCVLHTLGARPSTNDESFARRVADLQTYLLQHKPERDLAAVGAAALEGIPTVWTGR